MFAEDEPLLIRYRHYNCEVDPSVEWFDLWSCACNSTCPACRTKEIEPVEWVSAEFSFGLAKDEEFCDR